MDLPTAIQQIHFPGQSRAAESARHRLAFDEFLLIQLGMLRQRQKWQSQPGHADPPRPGPAGRLSGVAALPAHRSPAAQPGQILADLRSHAP